MTGAELIIRSLERHGVRIVAGVPGGAILPLYEALGRSAIIQHVLARHEQAAGFIAQGMARLTGRAGVCLATSGPGVTNIVTALADAKLDSVPLLCIAGQVPAHLIGTDAFQEVATLDLVRPITKACYFAHSARELPQLIAKGLRVAEQGRPGPVLIDVPKNVQLETVAPEHLVAIENVEALVSERSFAAEYRRAAEMIAEARRPVLYLGGGVVKARAQKLAREFAERAAIPVVTSLMALGVLPPEHPLNLGMLGMHGARYTNVAIEACDLLIAIGARFDDRATGDPQRFAANAKIIHIDIDARELGKIKQPELAIADDAFAALREIGERCARTRRDSWVEEVASFKLLHPLKTPHAAEVCSPYGIMRALGACLSADTIITTDVGQHQMWAAQALPIRNAERWLTSGGLGTMGFGLPAAIGAALCDDSVPVICITGDGSLLMNIQELATLAELSLNVKLVLLDNAALGLVRQQQELFYQKRFVASRFRERADFVAIARSFGIRAFDLSEEPLPHIALRDAIEERGPVLIRVPIDEQHHVLPMVAPGAANTQAIDHVS